MEREIAVRMVSLASIFFGTELMGDFAVVVDDADRFQLISRLIFRSRQYTRHSSRIFPFFFLYIYVSSHHILKTNKFPLIWPKYSLLYC